MVCTYVISVLAAAALVAVKWLCCVRVRVAWKEGVCISANVCAAACVCVRVCISVWLSYRRSLIGHWLRLKVRVCVCACTYVFSVLAAAALVAVSGRKANRLLAPAGKRVAHLSLVSVRMEMCQLAQEKIHHSLNKTPLKRGTAAITPFVSLSCMIDDYPFPLSSGGLLLVKFLKRICRRTSERYTSMWYIYIRHAWIWSRTLRLHALHTPSTIIHIEYTTACKSDVASNVFASLHEQPVSARKRAASYKHMRYICAPRHARKRQKYYHTIYTVPARTSHTL